MFCLSANAFSINLMKKNIGLTKWILIVTKLFWGSVKNRSPYAYTTTRTRSSMKSASFRLKITPLMFYDCYIYVSRWLINWFGKIYFFLHMFYEVLNIIYIADFIILFARWLLKRNYLFIFSFFFITFEIIIIFWGEGGIVMRSVKFCVYVERGGNKVSRVS